MTSIFPRVVEQIKCRNLKLKQIHTVNGDNEPGERATDDKKLCGVTLISKSAAQSPKSSKQQKDVPCWHNCVLI